MNFVVTDFSKHGVFDDFSVYLGISMMGQLIVAAVCTKIGVETAEYGCNFI